MVWMFVFLQNSYVEILAFKVMVLGGGGCRRCLGHEPSWKGLMLFSEKPEKPPHTFHCVRTQQEGARSKGKVGFSQTPHMLVSRSWTSQPPEPWAIPFCSLWVWYFVIAAQLDWDSNLVKIIVIADIYWAFYTGYSKYFTYSISYDIYNNPRGVCTMKLS